MQSDWFTLPLEQKKATSPLQPWRVSELCASMCCRIVNDRNWWEYRRHLQRPSRGEQFHNTPVSKILVLLLRIVCSFPIADSSKSRCWQWQRRTKLETQNDAVGVYCKQVGGKSSMMWELYKPPYPVFEGYSVGLTLPGDGRQSPWSYPENRTTIIAIDISRQLMAKDRNLPSVPSFVEAFQQICLILGNVNARL